jgi:hypothetical protein
MDQDKNPQPPPEQEAWDATAAASPDKQPWQDPKLTFVEPTLTKHGDLTAVTAAFFGGFTP